MTMRARVFVGLTMAFGATLAHSAAAQSTPVGVGALLDSRTYQGCLNEPGIVSECWTYDARLAVYTAGVPGQRSLYLTPMIALACALGPDYANPYRFGYAAGANFEDNYWGMIGSPGTYLMGEPNTDLLPDTWNNTFLVTQEPCTVNGEGAPAGMPLCIPGIVGLDIVDRPGVLFAAVTTTPEPATLALLAPGLLGLGMVARRRRTRDG